MEPIVYLHEVWPKVRKWEDCCDCHRTLTISSRRIKLFIIEDLSPVSAVSHFLLPLPLQFTLPLPPSPDLSLSFLTLPLECECCVYCVYYCSTYYKAVHKGGGGGSDPVVSLVCDGQVEDQDLAPGIVLEVIWNCVCLLRERYVY